MKASLLTSICHFYLKRYPETQIRPEGEGAIKVTNPGLVDSKSETQGVDRTPQKELATHAFIEFSY